MRGSPSVAAIFLLVMVAKSTWLFFIRKPMKSEPNIPCFRSWIWYYHTTTSSPELPSTNHTYKNILSEITPDGVHSSPFATEDETHFAV